MACRLLAVKLRAAMRHRLKLARRMKERKRRWEERLQYGRWLKAGVAAKIQQMKEAENAWARKKQQMKEAENAWARKIQQMKEATASLHAAVGRNKMGGG